MLLPSKKCPVFILALQKPCLWYALRRNGCGTEADICHIFQLAIRIPTYVPLPNHALQLHAGFGFFEPTFGQPSMSLIIHSQNQSHLIEIFDFILIFWK